MTDDQVVELSKIAESNPTLVKQYLNNSSSDKIATTTRYYNGYYEILYCFAGVKIASVKTEGNNNTEFTFSKDDVSSGNKRYKELTALGSALDKSTDWENHRRLITDFFHQADEVTVASEKIVVTKFNADITIQKSARNPNYPYEVLVNRRFHSYHSLVGALNTVAARSYADYLY